MFFCFFYNAIRFPSFTARETFIVSKIYVCGFFLIYKLDKHSGWSEVNLHLISVALRGWLWRITAALQVDVSTQWGSEWPWVRASVPRSCVPSVSVPPPRSVAHGAVRRPHVSLTAAPCVPQVSFSEGGPGSNSTGSEVASMSSQLPDTPNSMVSSPIEAWADSSRTDWTEHTAPAQPTPPTAPSNPLVVFWHCEDNHGILP